MPGPSGVTSYDRVPYTSRPFPQTYPNRLAAIGALFGLTPPSVEDCRILELGCASGGNLIPMGVAFPRSRAIGVDLSSRQIDEGRRTVIELGLTNVDLRHTALNQVDMRFGRFDYIICHGVYSWVAREDQERILQICRDCLAPNGIAFISYNTYPGWHVRGMVRDMMRYHASRFSDPDLQVRQARALLKFLARSTPGPEGVYGQLLEQEIAALAGKPDSYLLHEHLEEVNEPLYFHQFAERAAAAGLRYIGEAEVASMAAHNYPADVQQTLQRLSPDQIAAEQYMDFLRNRTFRQTLLAHSTAPVKHRVNPERLYSLHVASRAAPVAPADDGSTTSRTFSGPREEKLTTADPVLSAALMRLAETWPQALSFDALAEMSIAGPADPSQRRSLATNLLRCYFSTNLIELYTVPMPLVLTIGDKPTASPLARLQAASSSTVTNLRHEAVQLAPAERVALRVLDGRHDRHGVLEALSAAVADGTLTAQHDGKTVDQAAEIQSVVGGAVDRILTRIARSALLTG